MARKLIAREYDGTTQLGPERPRTTVYLLPECENEEEARQYLGRCAVK